MTPHFCAASCVAANSAFEYASLQDYQICYCGDASAADDFVEATNNADCVYHCFGDHTKACGGGSRANVYHIDSTPGECERSSCTVLYPAIM